MYEKIRMEPKEEHSTQKGAGYIVRGNCLRYWEWIPVGRSGTPFKTQPGTIGCLLERLHLYRSLRERQGGQYFSESDHPQSKGVMLPLMRSENLAMN